MLEDDVNSEESEVSQIGSDSVGMGSLYADHEIKRDLVLGPVEIKRPVLTFKFQVAAKAKFQPKSSSHTCKTCQKGNGMHYSCSECSTVFYSKLSMIAHLRRHKHPLICKICNKEFEFAFHLKKHMIKHSNIKQFSCDICQKAFKHAYSLQVHNNHNCVKPEKKPFPCEYCAKSFAFKGQLQAHSRRHTGEKPYECYLCLDKFSQQTSLNNHILKHKGIKPHCCKLCKKTFRQVSNLKQHIKVKHSDEKVERPEKMKNHEKVEHPERTKCHEMVEHHDKSRVALVWYSCKNCKSMFLGSKKFNKHTKVCK